MPIQFRVEAVNKALERNEFTPEQSIVLLGMIRSLESGDTLVEVVESLETQFPNASEVLDTLDLASAWIRTRQRELNIIIE